MKECIFFKKNKSKVIILIMVILVIPFFSATEFGYNYLDNKLTGTTNNTYINQTIINGTPTDNASIYHNELTGLDGGSSGEYYHVNQTVWQRILDYVFSWITKDDIQDRMYVNGTNSNATYILYNTSYSSPGTEEVGTTYWDTVDGTLSIKQSDEVSLQIGRELHYYGKLSEDVTNGQVCQYNGVQGDHVLIKKGNATELIADPFRFMSIATESGTTGEYIRCTRFGKVNNVYTRHWNGTDWIQWTAGDALYWDNTNGSQLTNVIPIAPQIRIEVGYVVKATTGAAENGVIEIDYEYNNRLQDLDDVNGYAPNETGQFYVWNNDSSVFELRNDYNATGLIQDWNSTGYIIDWNSTSLIVNWSEIIVSGGDNSSWNESYANTLYYPLNSNPNNYTTNESALVYTNSSGLIINWSNVITSTPSAPNNSVQFNLNNQFTGSTDFTYNNFTKYLTLSDNTKLTLGTDNDALFYFNGNSTIIKGANTVNDIPATEVNTLYLQGFSNIFWNDSMQQGGIFSGSNFLARVNFNTRYDSQSGSSLTSLGNTQVGTLNRMKIDSTSIDTNNNTINWVVQIPNTNNNRFGNPIELSTGWNMFSITNLNSSVQDTTTKQSITLNLSAGENLIGYSSNSKSYNIYNATFTYFNGTNITFEEAYKRGEISLPKKIFKGVNTASPPLGYNPSLILEPNQAYWFNAKNTSNITLTNVGGAYRNATYTIGQLRFSNGSVEKSFDQAYIAGWVDTILWYRNGASWVQIYSDDPETTPIYAWKGYFLRSKKENITVYIHEQKIQSAYSLTINYSTINSNSTMKAPTNITYYLNGGNFTMVPNVSQFIQNWNSSGLIINWSTLATAGGSNTQIQFNDNGAFNGSNRFVFNKTSGVVKIGLQENISGGLIVNNIKDTYLNTTLTSSNACDIFGGLNYLPFSFNTVPTAGTLTFTNGSLSGNTYSYSVVLTTSGCGGTKQVLNINDTGITNPTGMYFTVTGSTVTDPFIETTNLTVSTGTTGSPTYVPVENIVPSILPNGTLPFGKWYIFFYQPASPQAGKLYMLASTSQDTGSGGKDVLTIYNTYNLLNTVTAGNVQLINMENQSMIETYALEAKNGIKTPFINLTDGIVTNKLTASGTVSFSSPLTISYQSPTAGSNSAFIGIVSATGTVAQNATLVGGFQGQGNLAGDFMNKTFYQQVFKAYPRVTSSTNGTIGWARLYDADMGYYNAKQINLTEFTIFAGNFQRSAGVEYFEDNVSINNLYGLRIWGIDDFGNTSGYLGTNRYGVTIESNKTGIWFGDEKNSHIYFNGSSSVYNSSSGHRFIGNVFMESINISGNVVINGNLSVKRPYGMFSSTEDQTLALANTAYPVTFNWTEDAYLVNKEGDSNFSVLHNGDYLIEISAILQTAVANKNVHIFPQIWNGTQWNNVPRSNTETALRTSSSDYVISVPFILDVHTNEKFRLMWGADDNGIFLNYKTNTSWSPETPSIIMTVSKISETTD